MSVRFPALSLLIAMLGTVVGASTASAKPPGLPQEYNVECQSTENEESPPIFLFGFGLEGDASFSDFPCTNEEQPASTPFTCPYLRQRTAEKSVSKQPDLSHRTVLDNLKNLEQARTLLLKAESLRRHGKFEEAEHVYQMVEKLCPGSRYGQLALAGLRSLHDAEAAEEAESDSDGIDESEEEDETLVPGVAVEARVAELIEDGQRALVEGRFEEAAQLAHRALALDRDCIAAQVLFKQVHSRRRSITLSSPERERIPKDPAQPAPNPVPVEKDIDGPNHDLDAGIDPRIIDQLQRALLETGDPMMPRLILYLDGEDDASALHPTISPQGGGQGEEAAEEEDLHLGLAWPSPPPEPEIPSLYLQPPSYSDVAVSYENEDVGDEELSGHAADLNDILRNAAEAIRAGEATEIDCTKALCWRQGSELHVGGVRLQLALSKNGLWRFVVVSLTPEVSGDLRAAQRSQLDRTLRWIEAMNSNSEERVNHRSTQAAEEYEDLEDEVARIDE